MKHGLSEKPYPSPDVLLRECDSNTRPPGSNPDEHSTALSRDILYSLFFISLNLRNSSSNLRYGPSLRANFFHHFIIPSV